MCHIDLLISWKSLCEKAKPAHPPKCQTGAGKRKQRVNLSTAFRHFYLSWQIQESASFLSLVHIYYKHTENGEVLILRVERRQLVHSVWRWMILRHVDGKKREEEEVAVMIKKRQIVCFPFALPAAGGSCGSGWSEFVATCSVCFVSHLLHPFPVCVRQSSYKKGWRGTLPICTCKKRNVGLRCYIHI